jgi:hypothetical protein
MACLSSFAGDEIWTHRLAPMNRIRFMSLHKRTLHVLLPVPEKYIEKGNERREGIIKKNSKAGRWNLIF